MGTLRFGSACMVLWLCCGGRDHEGALAAALAPYLAPGAARSLAPLNPTHSPPPHSHAHTASHSNAQQQGQQGQRGPAGSVLDHAPRTAHSEAAAAAVVGGVGTVEITQGAEAAVVLHSACVSRSAEMGAAEDFYFHLGRTCVSFSR